MPLDRPHQLTPPVTVIDGEDDDPGRSSAPVGAVRFDKWRRYEREFD
jgi:hypothetical protein